MAPVLAGMAVASTIGEIFSTRQQGKDAQKISEARARVDEANAAAAMKSATDAAHRTLERGKEIIGSQKSAYGKNVRVAGSATNVMARTRELVARDAEYILEGGATVRAGYLNQASIERATGKQIKRRSRLASINAGLKGGASLAYLGYKGGWLQGGGGSGQYNSPGIIEARDRG